MTTGEEEEAGVVLLRRLAQAHRAQRQRLAAAVQLAGSRQWRRLDPKRLTQSWDAGVGRTVTQLATAAQLKAAETSNTYVRGAAMLQGLSPATEGGELDPRMLAGVASDGRQLASLLYQALLNTQFRIDRGLAEREAMDLGERALQQMLGTQVADAGRIGDSVSTVARPQLSYYVRLLTPPSCSRCAILAGQVYRSERAFPRHPRCDCIHVPVGDKRTGNALKTDPKSYFESLSKAEQDRIFTIGGAQAIRDGADIFQVVNARRGMSVAGSFTTRAEGPNLPGRNDLLTTHRGRVQTTNLFGRELLTTTAGRTPRGAPARLMPEAIYQIAKDRAEILSLLRRYGYLR